VAWRDEAQWLAMKGEQVVAVVVVKEGPSWKRDLPSLWFEQDDEVSSVASKPKGG